jgi:hypothetical protein
MKDLGIAEALFQSLLNLFWLVKSRSALQPFQLFPKGSLISYAALCRQAGVPFMTHSAGGPLEEIATYCEQHHWPPINALAVNHDSRYPGEGYFSAPGCSHTLDGWVDDVRAVLAFDQYPKICPPLPSKT